MQTDKQTRLTDKTKSKTNRQDKQSYNRNRQTRQTDKIVEKINRHTTETGRQINRQEKGKHARP